MIFAHLDGDFRLGVKGQGHKVMAAGKYCESIDSQPLKGYEPKLTKNCICKTTNLLGFNIIGSEVKYTATAMEIL